MKVRHSLILVTSLGILPGVLPGVSAEAMELPGSKCIECHSRPSVMPGIYNQYLKSMHFKVSVTCIDCHGAREEDNDACRHHNEWISIIVTPNDCSSSKCHKEQAAEFNRSAHHNAYALVTGGCGRLFSENLVNSQYPLTSDNNNENISHSDSDKFAGSTTACWRCHGSKIKMDPNKKGVPLPGTWPNSGMARENPDGSVGNCAACHESHEFSLAQARQPESCAVCHNSGGGDPQLKHIFNREPG